HGGVVVAVRVLLESLGAGVEVGQVELARGGPEECMLLVDRLERGELKRGEADGSDDDGHAAAGADVEGPNRRGRVDKGAEVRDDVEAIDDVLGDFVRGAGSGEVDAGVPLLENDNEILELRREWGGQIEGAECGRESTHELWRVMGGVGVL